jgi:DNA-binding GntR family transcriptional regulator
MKKITHSTMTDKVVAKLRKAILDRKLKPGQPLVQDQIARELNVSRMPVREALRALEIEGLVTTSPYKGSVVTKFTEDDIREIYQVRKLLEGFAVEQAVPLLTPEDISELEGIHNQMREKLADPDHKEYTELDRAFHRSIAKGSGNKRLIALIESIWRSFPPGLAHSIPGRIERSVKEHAEIVNAICDRDAAKASKLCRDQIEAVYNEISPYFEDN